jgi:stearoyl-CoA desaturase (Delta-9 desaturase)
MMTFPTWGPSFVNEANDDILYPHAGLFLLAHLAAVAVFWSGVTLESVALGVALYLVRMFGICAGYHRYFAHRSYATSRPVQFALACLAQSSGQKSVLWWAAKHRYHHLHSDTERDVHSPHWHGFWYSHVGWIFAVRHDQADLSKVADLARYPELMWLHRLEKLPAALLAITAWLIAGWPGLVLGFIWSTIILYHATFCINSLAHTHGSRRYLTGDESRNNWLLAVITLGEGWHNNHHVCASSVRQGFQWWEFDLTFYLLAGLRRLGLVWAFRLPPPSLVHNERIPSAAVLDRAANQLVRSFWGQQAVERRQPKFVVRLAPASEYLPDGRLQLGIPTRDELRECAAALFPQSPAIETVVDRTLSLLTAMDWEEEPAARREHSHRFMALRGGFRPAPRQFARRA